MFESALWIRSDVGSDSNRRRVRDHGWNSEVVVLQEVGSYSGSVLSCNSNLGLGLSLGLGLGLRVRVRD